MKKNSKAYPKKEWNVLELTKIAQNIKPQHTSNSQWKNDRWLAGLCQHMNKKNIQCDQLLISGHYSSSWHSEKENGFHLDPYAMLKFSCNPKYKCHNLFKAPSEILLLGCNTFTGSESNQNECTKKEIERRVNRYSDQFHMYNRHVAEEVVASQCLNFNITNRELFKSMFSGRIHGFDGTAPLGQNYASSFRNEWVNEFSRRIQKHKLIKKCELKNQYQSLISQYHACRKTFQSMKDFDRFLKKYVSQDLVPHLPVQGQKFNRFTRQCLGQPLHPTNPLCELVHTPDNPRSRSQQLDSIEKRLRGAANLFNTNDLSQGIRRLPLITKSLDDVEKFFGTSLENVCSNPQKYPGRQIDNICADFEYLSDPQIKKATLSFLNQKGLSSLPSIKLKLIRFYQLMGWRSSPSETEVLQQHSSQTLQRMLNHYSVDYFDSNTLDTFMRLKEKNIFPEFHIANNKIFNDKFHINTLKVLEELAGRGAEKTHSIHSKKFQTFKIIPFCPDGSQPQKKHRIYKCKNRPALKKKVISSKNADLYSLITNQRLLQISESEDRENVFKDLEQSIYNNTSYYNHPIKLEKTTIKKLNQLLKNTSNFKIKKSIYRTFAESGDPLCQLEEMNLTSDKAMRSLEQISCSKKINNCQYCHNTNSSGFF